MGSSTESVNDLLSPGRVLFAVNSSGRILRLETHAKTNASTQGWRVSGCNLNVNQWFDYIKVDPKACR